MRRIRSGSSAHSFLSRPFSRSTAPRSWYSFFQRAVPEARHVGNVRAAKGGSEDGVLADQGDGAGPGRQGVELLASAMPTIVRIE